MPTMKFFVNQSGNLDYTGYHSKRRITAIRNALVKWEFIEKEPSYVAEVGAYSCNLCALYIRNRCESCPIQQRTKRIHCNGTSFTKYIDCKYDEIKLSKRYARQMVTLLKKILEEEK